MSHVITRSIRLNQPHTTLIITGRGRNKTTHEVPVPEALKDIQRLITLTHDQVQSRLNLNQAYEDKALLNDYQAWAKEIDAEYDRATTTLS